MPTIDGAMTATFYCVLEPEVDGAAGSARGTPVVGAPGGMVCTARARAACSSASAFIASRVLNRNKKARVLASALSILTHEENV